MIVHFKPVHALLTCDWCGVEVASAFPPSAFPFLTLFAGRKLELPGLYLCPDCGATNGENDPPRV